VNQAAPRDEVAAEPLPAVLLPYQQRWVADRSLVKICEKSRQIGITWCTAAEAVMTAMLRRRDGGKDVWFMAATERDAKEFIRDCEMWVAAFCVLTGAAQQTMIEDEKEDILAFEIRFASGHRIHSLSSHPRRLRGKRGYAILDEAAHHDDLEAWMAAATAFLVWGGRIALISTHRGDQNPFNRMIVAARIGETDHSVHRTTFDEAIQQGLYRRICLGHGICWTERGEQAWRDMIIRTAVRHADEEFHCIPAASGESYLTGPMIERCMHDAPVLRLDLDDSFLELSDEQRTEQTNQWLHAVVDPLLRELDPGLDHSFGFDCGRTSDITVIAPVAVQYNLVRRVPFLVELRNVPFRQQERILLHIGGALPRLQQGVLDAGGIGMQLAEAAADQFGRYRIEELHLSERWYAENLPELRAAFEQQTILIPRCSNVRSDLQQIQLVNGIPKLPSARSRDDRGKSRHGDAAIAVALAYYATRGDDDLSYLRGA
jgi:phage FluMu gp28-like protein